MGEGIRVYGGFGEEHIGFFKEIKKDKFRPHA